MNQMNAPDSEQQEMISPSIAVGQRLCEARESSGLSREDVARELRLQEKLIAALEAGDLRQLPPAAYISGYLRSYARLLGMPADQLIAEYLAEPITPSLYRATDRTGMPKMTSRDPKIRLMSYAVAAVTALLFAAWWANEEFSFIPLETMQNVTGSEEQQELDAKLPMAEPLYQDPPAEEPLTTQEQDGTTGLPAGGGAVSSNVVVEPTPAPTVAAAPDTVAVAPAVSPAAEPPKPVQPLPTVVTEPLAASVAQSSLVLEYQAASWTQVEDAKGRLLVYETVSAGRKLQLQGVAPFKVFLGYASGVQVYYNGTLFPHADTHRGDLARFRVGSSQDNRPLVR